KAEKTLDHIGISTSKSTIPDDPNPPFRPSGLRIGIPAMTTRGVKEDDVRQIVAFMDDALRHADDIAYLASLKAKVVTWCKAFPVPSLG
ncbi:serine hydroxymethyltransferase, partial [Patescibacteria group bacterium]|nr:serine hydroxymethyltransferase [Patescibacteria group bacterium]